MRPSSISAISQSAIALSRRRLVRVQLTVDVPGLGRSGQLCLVQPGRMRNELLPHQKAIYQPLPIPTHSLKDNSSNAAQQSQIDEEQLNAEARHREQLQQQLELDRSLLLGLKSNLESITTLTFQRPTTTTPPPSSDPSSLPSPPLTIQGSISVSDILAHLRDDLNAFDITTEASPESQRLSVLQISKNLALDLNRSQASSSEDGFDKLGRIKKTGQYILDAEIIPSKTRIRIPVRVRPPAAEQVASISAMASSSTSPSSFSPSSQTSPKGTRAYSTSASQPLSMEASMLNKLTEAFSPAEINIRNDSSKHAHHAAMVAQGGGNGETHFFIEIVSDSFKGMTQIKRHRAINNLLKDEFERGLHALSLRTRTFEERDRQNDEGNEKVQNPTHCPKSEPNDSNSKFESRRSGEDQEEDSPERWQRISNLLGGGLALISTIYFVLWADFGEDEHCFSYVREKLDAENLKPFRLSRKDKDLLEGLGSR